jgi:hypothetical protein
MSEKEPGQIAYEADTGTVSYLKMPFNELPDNIKESYARVEAAIRADERAKAVPAGYTVVPVEPTKAMLEAGEEAAAWMDDATAIAYRAMIAAANPSQSPE